MSDTLPLSLAFFGVALLYGAVGQAGGSGYLAVMALAGLAPERMKPIALALNTLVACIAVYNFRRAGLFYPRAALPLILGAAPLAFLGGTVLPAAWWYRPALAAVLAFAAIRMWRTGESGQEIAGEPRLPWLAGLAIGAAIGLVAGITGTGGGFVLTPLLVFSGWASVRQSAGISALFILVSSLGGLIGSASAAGVLPGEELLIPALAAALGGFFGSWLGANRIPARPMMRILGVVLLIAALKLAVG